MKKPTPAFEKGGLIASTSIEQPLGNFINDLYPSYLQGLSDRLSMINKTLNLTPMQENKIKPIKIKQIDNGYIVQVGCKKIAISKQKDLIRLLTQYIENPNETEQKYNDGKLIKL